MKTFHGLLMTLIYFNGEMVITTMMMMMRMVMMMMMLMMIKTPMAATPSDSACFVSSMVSLKLQPDT